MKRLCVVGMIVISAGMLSACVAPAAQTPVDADIRQAQLAALTMYSFNGGLGIWTDEQSVSARMNWQQRGEELAVRLSGPLGFGNLALLDTQGMATLTRGDKIISQGRSIDTVVQNGLGLAAPVPMRQLQQWVRGLPGDAESVVSDERGRLASLNVQDAQGTRWQARFLKYTTWQGLELPALITASGGPYSVRLVLKNWKEIAGSKVPESKPSNTRLAIPTR